VNKAAALAAFLLATCSGQPAPPAIEVDNAWVRATAAGQSATAAYVTISNGGGADRLIGVSSAVGTASVHRATTEDGVARMRAEADLEIPAGSTVSLEPGGLHVMISGLNRPLEVGQSVALEFAFARSGKRQVMAAVRPTGTDGERI
jgi:periplasmic copper chaperone A